MLALTAARMAALGDACDSAHSCWSQKRPSQVQCVHLASMSAFRPQVHLPDVFEHCPVLFSRAGVMRSPGWLTRSSCIAVARSFSNPTLWCSDLRRQIGTCGSPFYSGFSMPGTASLNVLQSLTLVVTGRKATHTFSAYQAGLSLAASSG